MPGSQRKDDILRRSTFELPENLAPAELQCIQVKIPVGSDHLAAFYGAISLLAKWTSWQRDSSESGATVAQTWRNAITRSDFMTTCEGQPITITEWEDELSLKCNIRWCGDVLQVLDCGEWIDVPICDDGPNPVSTGQPGSTARPGPGDSSCFKVELMGNNRWKLPFAVLPGDLVTITQIDGAWSDGTIVWDCPDGTPFVAGQCFGAQIHEGTDPDSVEFHMQLIAQISSNYYSCTAPIAVTGVGAQDLYFQANDGTLADNQGSVSFQVCVTSGQDVPVTTWCHTFDFSADEGGWSVFDSCGVACPCGEWAAGGFQQPADNCTDNVFVLSPYMASGAIIKRVVMTMNPGLSSAINPYCLIADSENNNLVSDNFGGDVWDYDWSANTIEYPQIAIGWDPRLGSGQVYANQTVSIKLYGTGLDPFGTSNC